MLSPTVREALEAEVETLRYQRKRLDNQIAAIQAVLDSDDPVLATQRPLPIAPPIAPVPAAGPLTGKGLREAMKTVLTANPGGLRPAELVAKLEQGGFSVSGKMSLSSRVYAEIGRLRKEGRVAKGRGKTARWKWVVETGPEVAEGEEAG
jgi:hypothetical protein